MEYCKCGIWNVLCGMWKYRYTVLKSVTGMKEYTCTVVSTDSHSVDLYMYGRLPLQG